MEDLVNPLRIAGEEKEVAGREKKKGAKEAATATSASIKNFRI